MSHRSALPVLVLALAALSAPASQAADSMCVSHARGAGAHRCVVPTHVTVRAARFHVVAMPERADGSQHGFPG